MKVHPFMIPAFSFVLASSVLADDEAPLLSLTKGDRWEYQVTVEAPRGATLPTGKDVSIKKTADGVQATFKKSRVYVGKLKPKKDGKEVDTFQMVRAGKVVEFEFSEYRDEAIYALGSKDETRKDSKVILLAQPLLVYSSANQPGDQWEIKAGEGGTASAFSRKFRVFGEEEVRVPAGTFQAVRVVMTGQSGPTEIKRTFWFARGKGFVKEEKTYYSSNKRLIHQVMELSKLTKGKG